MNLLAFVVTLAISGPSALADGPPKDTVKTDDICAEHPDLCSDEAKPAPKPKKNRTAQGSSGRCRKKGESYNLNDASLPICGANKIAKKKKKTRDEDSFDELLEQMGEDEEGTGREPASSGERPTRRISFTSYLNSNANHPSIGGGRLGGRQEAFVVPTRSATFTAPSSVSVPVGDGSADGQSMRDFPAAPPASGSSSNNQNQ